MTEEPSRDSVVPPGPPVWVGQIASAFHEAYERLAPLHGYETRKDSAVPWEQVPEQNRRLMCSVVLDVFEHVGWLEADPDSIIDETFEATDFVTAREGSDEIIDLHGVGEYRPARVFTAWANEDHRV